MRSCLCLFAVCALAAGAAADAADEKALRAECVAQMRGWTKFCKSYRPDYSDSSKMLEPPLTGRLKKPLPLVVGGKPNAEIVYTPDALGVVSNAADELQFWVKK